MSWEDLQEELFEQLFKAEEDYITLKDLLESIQPIHKIWAGLDYLLLEDNTNDFDIFKSTDEIRLIDGFIIIKTGLWNYIVIDPVEKRSLTNEECKTLFDEEFFLKHFNEEETKNRFADMFYFEDAGKKDTVEKLIDYINEHQNILTEVNYVTYSVNYISSSVSVQVNFEKQEATIGFFKFDEKEDYPSHLNYLFFDKNAIITGASNPTNNIESLKAMGSRVGGIKIPKSILPDFVKDEKFKKMTYKSED